MSSSSTPKSGAVLLGVGGGCDGSIDPGSVVSGEIAPGATTVVVPFGLPLALHAAPASSARAAHRREIIRQGYRRSRADAKWQFLAAFTGARRRAANLQ
ncbi:MAG: hypothetical protein ABI895_37155 [Deltaproteobacteria bacterium]